MAVRKPRPPRFTANNGTCAAADGARGGEQRAVAAEHDDQIARLPGSSFASIAPLVPA